MSVHQGTLVNAAWPEGTIGANALRALALIIFGSLLMTVGAKVEVPFYPVPMTMQTFALILIIGCYGARLATASVGLYLLQGLAGIPVFATALAGPGYFAGPTGGYLVGFLIAAAVGGWLVDRTSGRGVLRLGGILLISLAIVFACGLVWLSGWLYWSGFAESLSSGVVAAIQSGFLPFALGDLAKLCLAVAAIAAGWQAVKPR